MRQTAIVALLAPMFVWFGSGTAEAVEGMWQPKQLVDHAETMRKLGARIDPATLENLSNYPMGAVVSLGGCSASFVSPKGLVVTNHHCARGSIQFNSSKEHNYLVDGFLATTFASEVPAAPGSRIFVTESLTDVTAEIVGGIDPSVRGAERQKAIENHRKAVIAACESSPDFRCEVNEFHGGLEYYLEKKLAIRDVRLVYAPADSVGVYGGDIDNWQWPRHTGDFAFYRAYVGTDGRVADFDAKNVPYVPKMVLNLNPRGISEGDFVMVAGYPGRTQRYRLPEEVAYHFEKFNPETHELLSALIAQIEDATASRPEARIAYASILASLNNAEKNYRGSLEGAQRIDLVATRKREFGAFEAWLASGSAAGPSGSAALADLRALVAREQAVAQQRFTYRMMRALTWILPSASELYRWAVQQERPDAEREIGYQDRDKKSFEERLRSMTRRYDRDVEAQLMTYLLARYAKIAPEYRVKAVDDTFGIGTGAFDAKAVRKKVDAYLAGTKLHDEAVRVKWMTEPVKSFVDGARSDTALRLAIASHERFEALRDLDKELDGESQRLRSRVMQAMLAFARENGRPIYPDANGTLRITFGQVLGSAPRDGLQYQAFTHLEGVLEKHTGEDPFNASKLQRELIRSNDFGPYYAPESMSVPVNFLATLDITGGNSGSPVLDRDGSLVGLAFDSTYEGIVSDWAFETERGRTIAVDIRYMLWVMDKLDRATNLLTEMGLNDLTRLKMSDRR